MSEQPAGVSDSWKKSSFSQEGGCVEVRAHGDRIQVRDSKDPDSAVLVFTTKEWSFFVAGVAAGEFNLYHRNAVLP
jgi:hypothetical protein